MNKRLISFRTVCGDYANLLTHLVGSVILVIGHQWFYHGYVKHIKNLILKELSLKGH